MPEYAEEVERELSAIMSSTYLLLQNMVPRYGEQAVDCVFNGVMSLRDFAEYVYFEYCTGEFIARDTVCAVNKHLSQLQKKFEKAYADNLEDDSEYSYTWLALIHFHSKAAKISNQIQKMQDGRNLPECDTVDEKYWRSLVDVLQYSGDSRGQVRKGTPLKRVHFYNAFTMYALKPNYFKIHTTMSLSRTNPDQMMAIYSRQEDFLRHYMLNEYNPNYKGEELEHYLAQAINLVRLEDRFKLNTMYRLAFSIFQKDPAYFSTGEMRYRFSDFPPMCFNSIIPLTLPGDADKPCPDETMDQVFASTYAMYISIYKQYVSEPEFKISPIICPGPVLLNNMYIKYLTSYTPLMCLLEEYRYDTILILAQCLLKMMRDNATVLHYSNEKFSWFIHNKYNIFDEFREEMEFHKKNPLTKKVTSILRQIAENMKPIEEENNDK